MMMIIIVNAVIVILMVINTVIVIWRVPLPYSLVEMLASEQGHESTANDDDDDDDGDDDDDDANDDNDDDEDSGEGELEGRPLLVPPAALLPSKSPSPSNYTIRTGTAVCTYLPVPGTMVTPSAVVLLYLVPGTMVTPSAVVLLYLVPGTMVASSWYHCNCTLVKHTMGTILVLRTMHQVGLTKCSRNSC